VVEAAMADSWALSLVRLPATKEATAVEAAMEADEGVVAGIKGQEILIPMSLAALLTSNRG
jgi:hypothetical protein